MINKTDRLIKKLRQIRQALLHNGSGNISPEEIAAVLESAETKIIDKSCGVSGMEIATENPYRYIFDKAPIGIIYYDSDGVITACNDQFMAIMGAEKQTLLGLELTKLPDRAMAETVKTSLDGEKSCYEGEYTFSSSGKTMPIRFEYHPIVNNEGDVSGGIGMLEDITERFEATKQLRESEHRYRSIFENKHTVMLIIDPGDGSINDANPAAVQFYGWSHDEMTRMKISDINTLTREEVQTEMERAAHADSNKFHFRHRVADGSERDVEVYSGIIKLDGKLRLYSIVHDITERLSAETNLLKFKLGIERSANIVFITDKKGVFQYVNPAFEKLYGYSLKDVAGKTPRVIKSGIHDEEYYQDFWDTISAGNVKKGTIINRSKDGALLNIRFTSNPIINDQGSLLGYIAIQEDITEQKEKEEFIQKSLKEKNILLSEIHHRVKNNLAVISAMMQLQMFQETDERVSDKLNESVGRIQTMASLHELLYNTSNFSRIPLDKNIRSIVSNSAHTYDESETVDINYSLEPVEVNINQAIPSR